MDAPLQAEIERIHASSTLAAIAVTGAGSQFLAWLLGVGGASRTLLEAVIPYGAQAMIDFLGWVPEKYVSEGIAVALAARVYSRALRFRERPERTIGLSCTATIATDRIKRGDHECYISVWDGQTVNTYFLKLDKGARDRPGEETVVSELILHALAKACELEPGIAISLTANEHVETSRATVERPLERLVGEEVGYLMAYDHQAMIADQPFSAALLSGSFNPLHNGHLLLARAAERHLGQPVLFELPIRNAAKPPLSAGEIEKRLDQFVADWTPIILDREPLFRDKAKLFSGTVFVVGYDTAVRLLDPIYYDGGTAGLGSALREIRDAGCRFLVGGRLTEQGFGTLENIAIPQEFQDLFEGMTEAEFRVDLSSTDLRAGKNSWT